MAKKPKLPIATELLNEILAHLLSTEPGFNPELAHLGDAAFTLREEGLRFQVACTKHEMKVKIITNKNISFDVPDFDREFEESSLYGFLSAKRQSREVWKVYGTASQNQPLPQFWTKANLPETMQDSLDGIGRLCYFYINVMWA